MYFYRKLSRIFSLPDANCFKSKFEEAKKITQKSEDSEVICPKSTSANTEEVTTKLDKLEVSGKEESN
ncbi:hypothetical protein TcasGA2_TC031166 [Tribolium castaneum]|uniref:Uncharacterized protein n=1 Tax=Tribolium castaneum TaxID=7070 RepID=A0A139W928_TRICA|nr:hypothetical protein TcasGA2_TC031166 [Tribolium castaneum]